MLSKCPHEQYGFASDKEVLQVNTILFFISGIDLQNSENLLAFESWAASSTLKSKPVLSIFHNSSSLMLFMYSNSASTANTIED